MAFYQTPPELANQFDDDQILRDFLEKEIPAEILSRIEPDLRQLGKRVASDILKLQNSAEENPPVHIPFDPWGKRIDEIRVSSAWEEMEKISAREGIVAIGYERKEREFSRLYQFAKLYLFHPSSAIYSCPLAMTDGAARLIEIHGDDELKSNAYRHLTSRDPEKFWTSGQWMTERSGGSDVSGTETIARVSGEGYALSGTKWFTSATTSQMAMTLAKIEGEEKLSLFYLELRDKNGNLQNIQINRLKDKLGTKALPTAELTLMGTPARLVGEKGKGVKTISSLFNITRIYNACCAVGYMRRGIALATDYSKKREAFGKKLIDHDLHARTLSDLKIRFEVSFLLTFEAVRLLGKEELGLISESESQFLRLLIPLVKLFTAKEGVEIASEVIESFGGAGYVEDTHLPEILRNAQVLAIWEGTTNVLSLDALRAIQKEKAIIGFMEEIKKKLGTGTGSSIQAIEKSMTEIQEILSKSSPEEIAGDARSFAFKLASTFGAALLVEKSTWEEENKRTPRTAIVLKAWIGKMERRSHRSMVTMNELRGLL